MKNIVIKPGAKMPDIIIEIVEKGVFAEKRKLSEFERNLVLMGACAAADLKKAIQQSAFQQPEEIQSDYYAHANVRMDNELEQYYQGMIQPIHEFHCDDCQEKKKKAGETEGTPQ
jgi:hypothetical protein